MNAHLLSMKAATAVLALAAWLALFAACGDGAKSPGETPPADGETPAGDGGAFRLSSEAFNPGEEIPAAHTCDRHLHLGHCSVLSSIRSSRRRAPRPGSARMR